MQSDKLNLGCGPKRTQYKGYVNVDSDSRLSPDKIWDVNIGLSPWPNESVIEVRCENLLDSLDKENGVQLIREIWRVLKPGGEFHFHQGDVAKNPDMCFGWPGFKSAWTRNDFRHFTIGEGAYENWYEYWDLPGFINVEIKHNANGIMIGVMVKPKPETTIGE